MITDCTNADGLSQATRDLIALPRCLYCGLGMSGESGRMHDNCRHEVEDIVIDWQLYRGEYARAGLTEWAGRMAHELELHYRSLARLD